MIHKLVEFIVKVIKPLLALMLIALVALTFAQIVSRTFMNRGISWAEECSRYIFIWAIYIGVALSVKEKSTINIEILTSKFQNSPLKYLFLVIKWVGSCVLFVVLAKYGAQFASMGQGANAQLLPIKMSFVYVSMPISGALCILFTLDDIIETIKLGKKKG